MQALMNGFGNDLLRCKQTRWDSMVGEQSRWVNHNLNLHVTNLEIER